MNFDFLVPLENYRIIRSSPNGIENWGNSAFLTYLLIQDHINLKNLEKIRPGTSKVKINAVNNAM